MRKKGILVTIGIVLALAVYVVVGVVYFNPHLLDQKEVVTKKVVLPKAKVEEKVVPVAKVEPPPVEKPVVAPPAVVEVKKPDVTPPVVEPTPTVVEAEKPVVTPPAVDPVPSAVEVEKPVVVDKEEIPSEVKVEEITIVAKVEEPPTIEVVTEEPVVKVEDVAKARTFERVIPTVEIEWTPPQIIPTLSRDLSVALPTFTSRAIPTEVEVVEVAEVKERVFERIQPTVILPPYERHTEPTLYRAEVVEPLFKAPTPVVLFWDPPQVAEEPRYVSIPTFLAEAQKARQEAVDAIFDKLVWP